MKGKIVIALFALPFFAVGVWMRWSVSSSLHDAWRMQDRVQVEARLIRGGYETHQGDDSDTYQAYAEYAYTYGGLRLSGDRVSLGEGFKGESEAKAAMRIITKELSLPETPARRPPSNEDDLLGVLN